MRLDEVYNELKELGINARIKKRSIFTGSDYCDFSEIIIKKQEKKLIISSWSDLDKTNKIFDGKYEHIITPDSLDVKKLHVNCVKKMPKGSWYKYDAHVYFCESFETLLNKCIKDFLDLEITEKSFKQISLFDSSIDPILIEDDDHGENDLEL
ncbi:MAG: hypothetical protein ACLRYM_14785 [Thomasclavelia ramosa]